MVSYDDISSGAMELFEEIADLTGMPVTQVIDTMPSIGIDPTEVTNEQAESLFEAVENEDWEGADDVLEEIGVPDTQREEIVDSFRKIDDGEIDPQEAVADSSDASESAGVTDDDDENKEVARAEASGDGLSRRDVQRMIDDRVPSAEQIAAQLETRLSNNQGGQQQQQQEVSPQQRLAFQLAQQYLQPSQGPMNEVAQEAQTKMMEGFAEAMKHQSKSMATPSVGQRVGHAIDDQIATSIAENIDIQIGGDNIDVSPPTAADGGEETEGDDDGE